MAHISDEVLRSLCDGSDYSKLISAIQEVRDYLQENIANSLLSRVLYRQPLNDRFPIFGKDDQFYTRNIVGYNDTHKRVTIPTFDIVTAPAVPYKYFRLRDTGKLRRVLDESVEAIKETQVEYLYALIQACGGRYNHCYPLVSTKEPLNGDFLLRSAGMMQVTGVRPVALFINQEDYTDEIAKATSDMGIELVSTAAPENDRAYYIFGQATDPELCAGHIVDNRTEFTLEGHNLVPGTLRDKERVKLQIVQNSGFLISQASVLKIDRVWEKGKPKLAEKDESSRQIRAFVVGEEGGDIVCLVS